VLSSTGFVANSAGQSVGVGSGLRLTILIWDFNCLLLFCAESNAKGN
jgi:hypothetical protein